LLTEKKAAAKAKSKQEREIREKRESEYLGSVLISEESKTGDPFKDFAAELQKVVSEEARSYI
jgi:hypothetical protein